MIVALCQLVLWAHCPTITNCAPVVILGIDAYFNISGGILQNDLAGFEAEIIKQI